MPSVSHLGPTHLGLDVHKDTLSVAILAPDRDGLDLDRIPHDEASVPRLVGHLADPSPLRACYEAGPTGLELARLLHRMHVFCEAIAPSLISKAPATRSRPTVGTAGDWCGCTRAGELVAMWIPTIRRSGPRSVPGPGRPGPRRTRARQRLSKSCWATANPGRGGNAWMLTHERWLGSQRFHEPALAATYAHYRAVLQGRDAHLEGIEADLVSRTDGDG
jgi:transposase